MKRTMRERNRKIAAMCVVLCALSLWMGGRVWAQAFQLAEFVKESDLKSEVSLKIGPAFPLGDFKAMTGESGLAQGAKLGLSVDAAYHRYFVPYFGLGVSLGAQIFGYDFSTAITTPYDGKLHKTGWGVYTAGISLDVRLPIIPKLYLIGNVQGLFGLMVGPHAKSVEKVVILDEAGKKIDTERHVTSVMRPKLQVDFLIGARFGLQYRVMKNLLAHLTVDYRYAIFANAHRQATEPLGTLSERAFRYAALGLGVGVAYAF